MNEKKEKSASVALGDSLFSASDSWSWSSWQDYLNTKQGRCQAALSIHEKELSENFTPKKQGSLKLASIYADLGFESRAQRCSVCGDYLEFVAPADFSEPFKLRYASFCRDRLCPLCAWRRSLRIFSQVSKVMNLLSAQGSRFVFVTLTVRNCSADELKDTIDLLQTSFSQRFMKNARVRQAFRGYFKTLEITRRPWNDPSIEFHPHLHVVFAVDPSYFMLSGGKPSYISHDLLASLWRSALGVDYLPSVNIEAVQDRSSGSQERSLNDAVAEVAKYSCKSSDYLGAFSYAENVRLVDVYLRSLTGRRLCSFGGSMKEAAASLALGDLIDGDLVSVGDEAPTIRADVQQVILRRCWRAGAYVLLPWE